MYCGTMGYICGVHDHGLGAVLRMLVVVVLLYALMCVAVGQLGMVCTLLVVGMMLLWVSVLRLVALLLVL